MVAAEGAAAAAREKVGEEEAMVMGVAEMVKGAVEKPAVVPLAVAAGLEVKSLV